MPLFKANRVECISATGGTGALTLGSATAGNRTFADAGVPTGLVPYSIVQNANWEVGVGTYDSGADTLTRTFVRQSSNANAAVNFAAADAVVTLTPLAEAVAAFIPIAAATISSGQILDITGIPQIYDELLLIYDDVQISTAGSLYWSLQMGGSWVSASGQVPSIPASGAGTCKAGFLSILHPNGPLAALVQGHYNATDNTDQRTGIGISPEAGYARTSTGITGIRLENNSTRTYVSGNFTLFGR